MPQRNKFISLLAMPVVVFFWVVGWSLYWIGLGDKKTLSKKRLAPDETRVTVLMPQQKCVARLPTLAG